MPDHDDSRAGRKRRAIMQAAMRLFLTRGYDGTSMDDVAMTAAVSKPTVYKHFADKEQLFSQIVLSTTGQAVGLVQMVTETFADTENVEQSLRDLARQFMEKLMEPDVLRLRRLVIATADRFPDVGRAWYESGFERALELLAGSFELLTAQGALNIDDPVMAANHFVGLLLWIPINRAMFTGSNSYSDAEIADAAVAGAAVDAFLRAYGVAALASASPPAASSHRARLRRARLTV
jgi:TetR/AcrR family transcriptional repressor of mexJK operon